MRKFKRPGFAFNRSMRLKDTRQRLCPAADFVPNFLQDSIPEHSLKIYRADQSSKYLLVNKTTSAKEVVMLSLKVCKIFAT